MSAYDLAERRIVGVEASVRWPHPERGMVMPDSFIPIAEDSGIIEQLGGWVLHRACKEMLALVGAARVGQHQPLHLAVNVSPRQFLSADFVGFIKSVLDECAFPAASLELEITESTLQATERSLSIVKALDELGVTISLDDFGTGYSSLSVLRDLSIKCIKIDRSFIIDLPANEGQRAVVEAIVALSRALHMSITVEGIERPEQADMLQALGCQRGQGLFFGRPMAFAELANCFSSALKPSAGL
jgi:EAL domain-containing protein (putative c-di-GMP-specific phosphodiesterase class I)